MDETSNSLPNELADLADLLSEIPEELVDEQTKDLLLAGERLLLRQMGLDDAPAARAPFKEVLAGVSRRGVVAEARKGENGGALTESSFRHRWGRMPEYLSDLVHFALRSLLSVVRYPKQMHDLQTSSSETPLVQMIEQVAYQEATTTHQNRAFRLQTAFQALFSHDEVLVRALRRVHRRQLDGWCDLYSEILKAQDLRLRPGITVEDLTLALHLAGKSVAFRALLGEEEGLEKYAKAIDPATGTTFLSKFALALLIGFIDPGDGRTLHQAAAVVLGDEPPAEGGDPSNPCTCRM
ncbi:hypothetical protein [Actinocorallia populi]|uniref:hypothetical protein n=1 Tax=Actinocorallia populi TaxID=2079200 RepID=UPI000D0876B9|nr:hypothetical protein [Actinocorallia populi]